MQAGWRHWKTVEIIMFTMQEKTRSGMYEFAHHTVIFSMRWLYVYNGILVTQLCPQMPIVNRLYFSCGNSSCQYSSIQKDFLLKLQATSTDINKHNSVPSLRYHWLKLQTAASFHYRSTTVRTMLKTLEVLKTLFTQLILNMNIWQNRFQFQQIN